MTKPKPNRTIYRRSDNGEITTKKYAEEHLHNNREGKNICSTTQETGTLIRAFQDYHSIALPY